MKRKPSLLFAKVTAAIVLISIVVGCTGIASHPITRTWNELRSDKVLVLHQPVTIPVKSASVVIQGGEVSPGGRNRYEPFCELVVDRLVEQPLTITPDRFTIEHVKGQTLYTDRSVPLQLAAFNGFRLASTGGDNALPMDVTETWRMRLHSPRQPYVTWLICGGEEDNLKDLAEPPTLAQIQAALGRIASLE